MQLRLAATAALLACTALPLGAQDTGPTLDVPGGSIRGATVDGALVFRGIPFAAPPTGERRWTPPAPVLPWHGVRDATRPGPACLQYSEGWNRSNWLYASEDCLTLDIRTPSLSGKRPVMVWIHGGSNRSGSSGGPADSDMSDQGVVLVGLQYRLGILGFLSHPALSAEQGGHSGNYGVMDQIAALEWVRDNIARFGGDPDNVTIFGESAGSQDVSLLLAAPTAQGLFDNAILQSGTPGFGMAYRSLAEGEALGLAFDRMAEAEGRTDKLRALSPAAVIELQKELGEPETRGASFVWLRPTIDGKVLPDAPDRLIARHAPKPVIVGTDKVEFGPASDAIDLDEFAAYWFGADGGQALAAYRAEQADARRGHLALRLQSDAQFHCPADRLADLLASRGWPVWRYEFDVGEEGGLTRHAYEIGFVFDRRPVGGGAQMQDYWAALALTGDPNGRTPLAQERPRWEPWNPAAPRQLLFGQDATAMQPGRPRAALCAFTEHY